MLKDKLQIYLITYNRKNKLKHTIEEILKSPVKDFDMVILDNASNDGSSEIISEYVQRYPNIKHIRHNINIGGNANICRAFELGASCGKEYFWTICDDDKYDFSNWNEVENEINKKTDIICVADYICDTPEKKLNKAHQIFQLTFVPAGIYKSSLITDDVLIAMYDNIYTMFQQSSPTINVINNNDSIHVLSKPIVFNGIHFEDKEEDLSFIRGCSKKKYITERRESMSWVLGFSNVLTLLKDKSLIKECMEVSIPYKDIYGSWENFYNCMYSQYINQNKINCFMEIYNCLLDKHKRVFDIKNNFIQNNFIQEELIYRINILQNQNLFLVESIKKLTSKLTFLQYVFSVRNEENKKVVRVLGIKMKFKRRGVC